MKKFLLTFVLLVGIAVGLFAQKLTYQAVVRNNNQQLVVNTDVKATVTITFSTGNPYSEEVNATTNIHGLLSFEFGGDALNGRNWEGATIAVKVVKANDESTVYVNDEHRPVSAVPYALSVNGQSIQNYLDENHYVDQTELDARHYLTSDSTVITTMQGDIAALQNASMDCSDVKNCIKDTLSKYTPTTDLCNELSNCQFSGQSLADLLQGLTNQISDLKEQVDSLSNLPHGGGDVPATFTCGTDKVKDVDGNEYNTVKIGNQCWMKENLRTKTHQYGQVWTKTDVDSAIYGRYYDWQAAMQIQQSNTMSYPASDKHRGICPEGWHVPSDAEWDTLTTYVNTEANGYRCDGDGTIAKALSQPTGWSNTDTGCNAGNTSDKANATGFSAVPAGYCLGGDFDEFGSYAYFWSATQNGDSYARYRYLYSGGSNVFSRYASKGFGYSVRCLRDAGVGGPAGGNEIAGTTPSAPGGDNACCSELGARLDSLEHVISSQDSTINALNEQVEDLLPFECGKSKLKDAEGNKYNTVAIGNQCWMKENLRTKLGTDGDKGYPEGAGNDTVTYGRLYTWSAMMNGKTSSNAVPSGVQGICPIGWHVPSDAEWDTLTYYVYNSTDPNYKCGTSCKSWQAQNIVSCIANALSSPTGWTSSEECCAGSDNLTRNLTGFSAVPAGGCFSGGFNQFGNIAYFWSATQSASGYAWCRSLANFGSPVYRSEGDKANGLSVRCLRDAGVGGGTTPSAPGGDNACCSELGARLDSLEHVISSQDSTINALNEQVNPFTCGSSKVKDVDNNEYNTVKIGSQCWTKENLRTTTHTYGQVWTNTGADSAIYGRYYDWQAAMQIDVDNNTLYSGSDVKHQGICPDGWHVPSDAEWDTLTDYVNTQANGYRCNGDGTIANALSSPTGWQSPSECCAGYSSETLNKTGFSAVPAGYFFISGFNTFGKYAYFWSATQYSAFSALCRILNSNGSSVNGNRGGKDYGFSVRCLRDAGVGGGTTPSAPATMSCEDVMECMGDTLGKLNEKIEAQGQTITTQGHTIDSLAHIVDSLSNLTPGGGDTPTAFTCGTDSIKDVDNNWYHTVKIGNQCWMAQNLRTDVGGGVYPKKNDGRDDLTPDEQVTYGRLYTWTAMMNGKASSDSVPSGVQGICPTGWHVPSDAEWTQLTTYVKSVPEYVCDGCSGTDDEWYTNCIAKALSQPTGWSNTGTGCNAGNTGDKANLTGFSAVPAGRCFFDYFSEFGNLAFFWSATQSDGISAWYRNLYSSDSYVYSYYDGKDYGFSVRCLRD